MNRDHPFNPVAETLAEPSQPSRNGRETPGRRPLAERPRSDPFRHRLQGLTVQMATKCDWAERVRADDHCVPDAQLARPERDLSIEVQAEKLPRLTPSAELHSRNGGRAVTVVASSTATSEVDAPIEPVFTTVDRSLREHVAATRVSVGLPERVEDPVVLARIAALLTARTDLAEAGIAGSPQGVGV